MSAETRTREQIAREHLWDVESVYTDTAAWEEDFKKLPDLLEPVKSLKGKLVSPEAVARVFAAEDALSLLLDKLYLYAHMREDEDTMVGENQGRMSRLRAQYARVRGEIAWIQPEILEQPEETLRAWVEHPALRDCRRSMILILREKPHTLSTAEETLLGLAGEIFSVPYETFGKLTNADLTFHDAVDSQGHAHEVTNGTFYTLLLKPDRKLRENAFGAIYEGYGDHRNALGTLLAGACKSHVFNARVRHFEGALDASLFPDNIPPTVYTSLIEAVHGALPAFQEYLSLRARRLGLGADLNMWDIHVPIVPDFQLEVGWEECRRWITESLEPLGPGYMEGVQESFSGRWYDVYENKGKRSGAYSTGAYGEKPFMLLNYHGTLSDVFTVAHELGHSMHTRLSHANQPYRFSSYPIFLAEIASTTNEALLHHYLVETRSDPRLRAYLLNHLCDSFRGTLFRQAMFAEFELEIHKRLESGSALTADSLDEYYFDLNARFHGDAIKADRRIAREWSRIPHFYYNFYVYKYSTGFVASQLFSRQILSGAAGRDAYLGFLKSGSSKDPLDTVRAAGVDLADPTAMQGAFETFRQAVRELGDLLEQIDKS